MTFYFHEQLIIKENLLKIESFYKNIEEKNRFFQCIKSNDIVFNLIQMSYIYKENHLVNMIDPMFLNKDMSEIYNLYTTTIKSIKNKKILKDNEKLALLYFVFTMAYKHEKYEDYIDKSTYWVKFSVLNNISDNILNDINKREKDIAFYIGRDIMAIKYANLLKTVFNKVNSYKKEYFLDSEAEKILNNFLRKNLLDLNLTNNDYDFYILDEKIIIKQEKLPLFRIQHEISRNKRESLFYINLSNILQKTVSEKYEGVFKKWDISMKDNNFIIDFKSSIKVDDEFLKLFFNILLKIEEHRIDEANLKINKLISDIKNNDIDEMDLKRNLHKFLRNKITDLDFQDLANFIKSKIRKEDLIKKIDEEKVSEKKIDKKRMKL